MAIGALAATYRARVADARRSYPVEKRRSEAATDLPSFLVYRPLSFWVTPLCLAGGMSASAVTVLGLTLALAMPLAAWGGGRAGYALVVLLALAVQVLDSVDGNVARMTGRSSAAGQVLDGLATLVFWAAYFVAVGLLARDASAAFAGRHGLEIGLGLAVLLLLQREFEDTHEAAFAERVRWGPYLGETAAAASAAWDLTRAGRVVEHVYAFGGLLVAGALGALGAFLAVMAVYQATLFVTWLPKFALALRRRG